MGLERSGWISPLEVLDTRFNLNISLTYKDILKTEGGIIKIKQREDIHEKINWFQYNQIVTFYEKDFKKYIQRKVFSVRRDQS